jgi:hypothetical protein
MHEAACSHHPTQPLRSAPPQGTVYKRMDPSKLWSLASMDIVERFHLLLAMAFVALEDMDSSAAWLPAAATVLECLRILASESLIDIIKHAVLGKFNDIRPGIFRCGAGGGCVVCACAGCLLVVVGGVAAG